MKIQSIKCTIHRDPNTKKQVIPLPAMEVAGLERTEELVFHAQEGCILVGRPGPYLSESALRLPGPSAGGRQQSGEQCPPPSARPSGPI